MKKIFVAFMMMLASISSIHAFDFDGISLNLRKAKIAQEITKRGYVYDAERDCLRGMCQGQEIFLRINDYDVKKEGMVGQLIIEMPNQNAPAALNHIVEVFNVIYHQVGKTDKTVTYQIDPDGTQLVVSQNGKSVILTYNTPYYKAAK